MTATTTSRDDLTNATRPALVAYLKAAGAYSGKIDGKFICRLTVGAMRAHALATWDAANAQRIEDEQAALAALEARHQQQAAKHAKAEPKAERCAITGRKLQARQIVASTIAHALAALGEASVPAIRRVCKAHGASPSDRAIAMSSWCNGDNGKRPSKFNPILVACIREGIACERAAASIKFTKLAEGAAADQRASYTAAVDGWKPTPRASVSATTLAGRDKAINAGTIAKLSALIVRLADDQGLVTADAEALAIAGLGASWARLSNRVLADAEHVTARTLAALGYTGRSSRGVLTLTPIAEVAEVAA